MWESCVGTPNQFFFERILIKLVNYQERPQRKTKALIPLAFLGVNADEL